MTAWTALSPNDFMKIDYLHKAYQNLVFLRDTMFGMLNRRVGLSPVDPGEDVYTVPYPALLNLIEENIEALTANGYLPTTMRPTRVWLGELRDIPRFSYKDVNRWFESFRNIYEMILGMSRILLVTGTFSTGEDRTRQLIRTVNK